MDRHKLNAAEKLQDCCDRNISVLCTYLNTLLSYELQRFRHAVAWLEKWCSLPGQSDRSTGILICAKQKIMSTTGLRKEFEI